MIILPGLESRIPLMTSLRPSTVAFRRSFGKPSLCLQDVLGWSRERTDRQQNSESETPQQQREGHRGAADRDEMGGGKAAAEAAAFPRRTVAAAHPRRHPLGMRALCKAGLALDEVFTCTPGFEFSCWHLITVWGSSQGNPQVPSTSISNPGSEEGRVPPAPLRSQGAL